MANRQLGPFELQDQLGAGGMGVVYRAKYTKTGQLVALKLLAPTLADDEKLVARFQRELDALKKLQHPHIVQCFGGGRLGKQRFYAMELVEGGSLAEMLKEKKRLAWEQVIEYGLQICAALEHAHESGIVHRDLKPANLMLDRKGRIKLADFGLARIADATALTAPGRTLGTYAYMAPEQITGKHPISAKTDLYSLGIVFYELLCGECPFQSEQVGELLMQHLKKKPEKIGTKVMDCPVWLDSLIMQLLEKDPEKRPRDALAVTQALREINQKVADHASVAQHTVTGEPSALTVETDKDKEEVSKLVKKKPGKKKRPQGQFYEQTWFLGTCLGVLLLFVTWVLWPAGEEKLFQKAAVLMAKDDPTEWLTARDNFLEPLQKRFPDGKHKTEVQEYLDRIEMHFAYQNMMNRIKRGSELKSEGERLFAEAWRYEQFGDRISAMEKYDGMASLLEGRPDLRVYALLARQQRAKIAGEGVEAGDRVHVVTEALDRADKLFASGNALEAKKIWDSIVNLYTGNRELEPQVARATARRAGRDYTPPADPSTPPSP